MPDFTCDGSSGLCSISYTATNAGVDVICVRGAACEPTEGFLRYGTVRSDIVRGLVPALSTTL